MIAHTTLAAGSQLLGAPLARLRIYGSLVSAVQSALPFPRVVLFVGMVGSGKTTACRAYVAHLRWPVGLITLRGGEEQGWSVVQPILEQLGLPAGHPAAAIAAIRTPTVVVVDQLEAALDENGAPLPAAAPWLAALLANSHIHIVLLSRIFPHLPDLALLAASNQLQIIDGPALAFTPEEVCALWRQRRGDELDPTQAELLVARSGGLPAMVALACSTGSILDDGDSPLHAVLLQHIMRHVPEPLVTLLTDTAVLERLTPSAIEALTGRDDGADLLRELRQRSLLVAERPARLHPLIRHELLFRLRAQQERFLHLTRLAVNVARAAGEYQQAWRLAAEAQLWDMARELVLQIGPRLREQGASRTLLQWIEALPLSVRDWEVQLLLAFGQLDVGDFDGAIITLSHLRALAADGTRQREATIWLAGVRQARGEIQQADDLIRSYLAEPSLEPQWRARVCRLHANALQRAGQEAEALAFAGHAVEAAQLAGDMRLLAFCYQDYGFIASESRHDAEGDQALRLAERCWRTVGSVGDLAYVLNQRAMLALGRQDYVAAESLARDARVQALAGDQLRYAVLAKATCGDVALAQGQLDDALRHYQVAAGEAERIGYFNMLIYCLALQAQIARLQGNRPLAGLLLQQLLSCTNNSLMDEAWLAVGLAAARLTLGVQPDLDGLHRLLERLGLGRAEVRAAVLILYAHCAWLAGDRVLARERWLELEAMLADLDGSTMYPLVAMARALPALFTEMAHDQRAAFARRALAQLDTPAPSLRTGVSAVPAAPGVLLRLQVLGTEVVHWQGQPVRLPRRGVGLLVLLLTTGQPLEDAALLRQLWDKTPVGPHGLKKLVVRVRALLPGLVRHVEGCYVLSLPREAIDFDLGRLLSVDIQAAPMEQLRELAEAAGVGVLLKHDAAWARQLRGEALHRLALIWLELGRRREAEGAYEQASEAYARAQQADPCSDLVARAALQQALRVGDRALAIQRYLRYRQALDEQLGVDPAEDLQQLYRQALGP